MRLHRRLSRLEQRVPDRGCPGCRERRGRTVMVVAHRLADGSVVHQNREPEACGQCGVVPEFVVKVITCVVGVRDRKDQVQHGKERP